MSTFIAIVLIGAILIWRVEAVFRTAIAKASTVAERKVQLQEEIAKPPKPERFEPMPEGLIKWANSESEPWAREQVSKALFEQYETFGDWDRVQRLNVLGIAN